jgi:hypothetical protein
VSVFFFFGMLQIHVNKKSVVTEVYNGLKFRNLM